MSIEFKLGTEEQIPVILAMMEEFNAIDNYPFDKETGKKNLLNFLSNKELGRLWVIVLKKEIVGYFVLTFGFSFEYKGRDAFIDEIFIKESFRNRGIGNESLKFLEEQAKELGIKAIHLEVERGNKTGSKLYMKNGFTGNDRILRTKRIAEE